MSQFTEQDFFGGAIRGVVPQGWIDSRLVYNLPMHQIPNGIPEYPNQT